MVVDLEQSRVLFSTRGSISALEPSPLCLFTGTTDAVVPPEGGVVQIPDVPSATCRPWSASVDPRSRVMNPGPHVGPATLLFDVKSNVEAVTVTHTFGFGGWLARVTPTSERPGGTGTQREGRGGSRRADVAAADRQRNPFVLDPGSLRG